MRPSGINMERFSVMAPSGHLSLAPADQLALAATYTPGENEDSRSSHSMDPAWEDYKGHGLSRPHSHTDMEQLQAVEFKPDMRFYLAFSALAALSLIIALDGTSISVALPVISQYLRGSAIEAFWAGTSFLLASTICQPIYASFSQIFGRKQMTLVAVMVFLVGTLLAATARMMLLMLVGRAMQGTGAGGITVLTNVLVTDLVPLRHRGNWVGILGATWAFGSVIGPVVGGSLAHANTWPYIFYLNVPFIVLSFFLVWFFIRLKNVPSSFLDKMRLADWLGSAIFMASMTATMIPLTWAGVSYPWTSWHVIVPFGFGVTGFALLWYHERFVAPEPVIRTAVFANRTTNIAYLTTALHGMILWCLLYYQPLYFEGVRGYTPVIAGVALFPATFTVAPMAIIAGILISKFGRFRRIVWAGWTMTTLGVGFLCAVDVNTQLTQVLITDLLCGVGLGALVIFNLWFDCMLTSSQSLSRAAISTTGGIESKGTRFCCRNVLILPRCWSNAWYCRRRQRFSEVSDYKHFVFYV